MGKVRRGLQSLQLVLVGEVKRPKIIGQRRAVKMVDYEGRDENRKEEKMIETRREATMMW